MKNFNALSASVIRRRLTAAGLAVLCLSTTLFGHHSLNNGYNLDRTITLEGVVAKVDWANPHVQYYVDVMDSSGQITNWKVEALAPPAMIKSGIDKAAIKIGDKMILVGYEGKNLPGFVKNAVVMTRLTLPGGKNLEIDPTRWMPPPQSQPAIR
jgi:hypothetical protein